MPRFAYVALDKGGSEKTGTLEMGSQNEAIARLKEMGLYPTSVTEEKVEVDKDGKKVVGKKRRRPDLRLSSRRSRPMSFAPLHASWLPWSMRVSLFCAACRCWASLKKTPT